MSVFDNKEELLEFEYQGKCYVGKVYNSEKAGFFITMVIMATFFIQVIEALLADVVKGIEDVDMFSGDVYQNIAYFIALLASVYCVHFIEEFIWKKLRKGRTVHVLYGNKKLVDGYVPMKKIEISFGAFLAWLIVFSLCTIVLIITKWEFMIVAVDATTFYLAIMIIYAFAMNRGKCEYYMPVKWGSKIVGVKEKRVTCITNKTLRGRNVNNRI